MITPDMLASSGTEDGEQAGLMQYCAMQMHVYPELRWLYHVPNGGGRGIGSEARKNGALMQKLGVKKGVLDIHLPVPRGNYACLYVEMKKPDGKGKLSIEQKAFITFIRGNYAAVAICDTWRDAWTAIELYLTGQFPSVGILDVKGYFRH